MYTEFLLCLSKITRFWRRFLYPLKTRINTPFFNVHFSRTRNFYFEPPNSTSTPVSKLKSTFNTRFNLQTDLQHPFRRSNRPQHPFQRSNRPSTPVSTFKSTFNPVSTFKSTFNTRFNVQTASQSANRYQPLQNY